MELLLRLLRGLSVKLQLQDLIFLFSMLALILTKYGMIVLLSYIKGQAR